ncbi:hydrogenase formation protein HypD [Sorangium sp. So ce1024]|uniref:hydrogenase formation protein HypD n=1 Tax=Sorangium sp. So ce1024 TaxID=3133327 RepID=UPI003F005C31
MRYVDEFRDPALAAPIVRDIAALLARLDRREDRPLKIMEVCGGHTHAIFRFGIGEMIPPGVELVHGPGCPVCVLPTGCIDDAIAVAETPGVILATFGDVMRVPGSRKSLLDARAQGADVRVVYAPTDALQIAREAPDREVVFLAIGFETTAPSTALTLLEAEREGARNFSILCHHVTVVPALRALLDAPRAELDGFIGPGHVSVVIGLEPYGVIARHYRKPLVVAGFEPLDVLAALRMVVQQIAEGRAAVENQYRRLVAPQGNLVARGAMMEVFAEAADREWRGLGTIPRSGLVLRGRFARFDALGRFAVPGARVGDHKACQCGEVLKGALKPWECKAFGAACTPETPIGACMVSSEGACAAYFNYGRRTAARRPQPTGARHG